ncbi:hypothetical protein P8452_76714 [Trifolium repens]|nr:hypothetical protein P8452_76714 [Trifolium repens]
MCVGAEQFLLDVAQNRNDIEEFIWCNFCKARLFGVDGANVLNIQLITEKVNCIVLTRLKLSLLGSL